MNCQKARRYTRKSPDFLRRAGFWTLTWAAVLFTSHPVCGESEGTAGSTTATEIAGYAKLARKAADESKWPLADHFLGLLGAVDAPDKAKKSAFRELAEDFEKKRQFARAIAVYEKMTQIYADDPDTPELIFRLGLLYRESGAPKLATARFYTVLNAALKFGSKDVEAYRTLARRAQWEIAETYFKSGDFKKAHKYYEMLSRLELPSPEIPRVRFRLAHCLFLADDVPGSIATAQSFLKEFPDDPAAAECHYLLARAFRTQGRGSEAFDSVLALLRHEDARKEQAPEKWIYWKKKAGNEFGSFYYQKGDTLNALTIFQAIARLGDEPEWQWPVIYQMGLCFERLRHGGRATDAYKYIIDESGKPGREKDKLSETLRSLLEMARWRTSQLAWNDGATVKLERLLADPLASPAPEPLKP